MDVKWSDIPLDWTQIPDVTCLVNRDVIATDDTLIPHVAKPKMVFAADVKDGDLFLTYEEGETEKVSASTSLYVNGRNYTSLVMCLTCISSQMQQENSEYVLWLCNRVDNKIELTGLQRATLKPLITSLPPNELSLVAIELLSRYRYFAAQ